LFLSSSVVPGPAAADDDFKLNGKWKLVFPVEGLDLVIFDVAAEDDALTATSVDAFQPLGKVDFKSVALTAGEVSLVFQCALDEIRFKGSPVTEGDYAGAVLGVLRLRGNPFPARLEKTDSDKIAPPMPNPVQQKMFAAIQTQDAKEKVKKLEELIHEAPGPGAQQAYTFLLQSAEAGGLTEDDVRKHVDTWLEGAKPYGAEWTTQCWIGALQSLQGKKSYAKLALDLARQAKKDLAADASIDQQAAVTQALAGAARLAGKKDLAAAAEAEMAVLDEKLDEEYHAKVPPFMPEPYAGREDPKNDRVVLFELFTGAQCPPCVAADVAFDALLSTYQPTELVTLQYHLHIPGPDPLTNPDSATRSQYYSLRGTPSTYFNGVSGAGGGGGMPQSKGKYDQFRQEIDKQLAGAKSAKIELQLTRSGDKILVSATAQASAKDDAKDDDEAKDDGEAKDEGESKLRLRVVLTEESIRYVGGNQLRFHHHVVRGFPGGVEGKALVAGEGKVELTIDLDEVREGLNKYLDDFAKGSGFPAALPKMDFKSLAVVAFVQDDADKRVLHAVQASVPEAQ
jgi:hypothetical protein